MIGWEPDVVGTIALSQKLVPSHKGMADWLGMVYLPFSEARAFVHALELEMRDHDDWLAYCRSGTKPADIPSRPEQVYRAEYKGMKDWLGIVDKWNSKALLEFLHGLQPQIGHLTNGGKDLERALREQGNHQTGVRCF